MWQAVHACALAAGFATAGVAAAPVPGSDEDLQQTERFRHWAGSGFAGEMEWMLRRNEAGEFVRGALHRAVPWARSVILCAVNYNADAPLSIDAAPEGSGWIARYAWGAGADGKPADYHDVLLQRLRVVEAELQRQCADAAEPLQTRCYVDTGPVVERHMAQLAGVGWIGKNTCVLNEREGSWLLLGVILTSLPLADHAHLLPAADRCGTCTRCIDACPTDALVAPRQMDASRCIAYLTIEKKGSIAEELREAMGRQVFGCDICQDVCPWNRRAPVGGLHDFVARREMVNPDLGELAATVETGFKAAFRGSPMERTGKRRLLRNIAIAMGNDGGARHDDVLRRWAGDAGDPVLQEAAGWALKRRAGTMKNDADA